MLMDVGGQHDVQVSFRRASYHLPLAETPLPIILQARD